ncbi:MAG: hypothetical protein ACOCV4_06340 [Myxococcota bacterium]
MEADRRMRPAALVGAIAVALAGCQDDRAVHPEAAPQGEDTETAADPAPAGPFGPDGELRESDRKVAGLPLPHGLEPIREKDRRHVYRATVPIEPVVRYFGPRLLTGQVDRVGEGAIYRRAVAKDARGAAVELDVSILPASSGTRVEIVEIRPPPPEPPPIDEIRRDLQARGRYGE